MNSVTMFVRNDLRNDSRVWKEAGALRDGGWRVRIIGVQSPETASAECIDGIEVVRVRRLALGTGIGAKIGGAQPVAKAPQAVRAPRRPLRATLRNWLGFARDELATAQFTTEALAAVSADPTDVYHAHDLNAMGAALAARTRHGGKVVFDAHEFFSERNFYRQPGAVEHAWIRRQERQACRRADACITVSEGIADELQSRYRLATRPTVVMNCPASAPAAAGTAVTPLKERLGIKGKLILYIGSATFNRGLEITLEALTALQDVHFAMMGPVQQGYRQSLETLASRLGVSERVHFVPAVPAGDVVATAATADAAVVLIQNACLSYYLCSPNKLFEALAAGLPVVASDFPDLRRVLAGQDVGVLVRPDDLEAVRAAIRNVLQMERQSVGEKARGISTRFSWAAESQKLLALYQPWMMEKATL